MGAVLAATLIEGASIEQVARLYRRRSVVKFIIGVINVVQFFLLFNFKGVPFQQNLPAILYIIGAGLTFIGAGMLFRVSQSRADMLLVALLALLLFVVRCGVVAAAQAFEYMQPHVETFSVILDVAMDLIAVAYLIFCFLGWRRIQELRPSYNCCGGTAEPPHTELSS